MPSEEPIWLIIKGDGGGIYSGTVDSVNGATCDVTVKYINKDDGAEWTAKVCGLPRNGDSIKKKGLEMFPKSMQGKNEACVVDRDDARPAEGFKDMTDMKVLNDAEVAENLRSMYQNKSAYVTHNPV